MKFATVEAVPLVKTGTWNGSTGSKAITKEDLEAIVEAHESAVLDKGVLKKGHLDPRHENPAWDGDPAYGQVDNLRLSDDGETLLGDYINVPEDLAESLPSAYPNRSAEIAWGVKLKDAAGKVTKEFKAALAGVALLGRTPPAVKGLGGPVSAFSASAVEFDSIGVFSVVTEFSLPGGLTANALREALSTAITDAFKDSTPKTNGEYSEWPWMVDYDDEKAWFRSNGGVFQVGYTASDGGAITLNDDVTEVIEKRSFVPVPDTATVPQTQLSETQANDVQGAESATENATKEEPSMSEHLKKLRDRLGLPETATEEEILAAAAEAVPEPAPESKVDADGKPVVEAEEQTNNSAATGKHAAPAAGDAPKTVIVSEAAFSELMASNQTNSEKLAAMEADNRKRHVAGLVSDYTKAGKIHPTEKSYFTEALATNEESTRKLLDARAGIPVVAIGSENVDPVQFSENQNFDDAFKFFNLPIGGN
ncbi:putative structural protein [Arthrobacter phage vB_ArtM-ArV1]|uniref:Putative structural protein n=1 Tax=Arthrobacter phage vB_ArtM-ArV1 TaxID=1566993 RepID=A0A0A7HE35_9CAUD|nr:head maturation protease [Arthrobacter phage vB_ArtM-ArV1]AIZ01695.1 putative structural protein [Arthrobacter phage vB_ArtM-ArV1]